MKFAACISRSQTPRCGFRPQLETLEDRTAPALFATGADAGVPPRIKVFESNGVLRFNFLAFSSSFQGGVRVAVGDVSGDATDDIIAAGGPGMRPRVRLFSGVDRTVITTFFPYGKAFRGGVYVAVGNFDADATLEIVTGTGAGRAPLVRVWDVTGETVSPITGSLHSFAPFGSGMSGGVTVAAGNIDGADLDEVIVAVADNGPPRVRAFRTDLSLAADFLAFGSAFRGGLFVAAGDLRGTAAEEILIGSGSGRASEVRIFTIGAGSPGPATRIDNRFPYGSGYQGGVRVGIIDYNSDGQFDVIAAPGRGRSPLVLVLNGANWVQLDAVVAYNGGQRGAFVGGSS